MPRRKSSVKGKHTTTGLIDLHFHGAFGVDLMTATAPVLTALSQKLWQHGVAAFCPTTLSAPRSPLLHTVERLGKWIRAQADSNYRDCGAIPLGIHLEGPFIHPEAAGAHPPGVIRELTLEEFEILWKSSQETLKIITLAPERLDPTIFKQLLKLCKRRGITLALGHSRATEAEARAAFDAGVAGVTHAWNAMVFHHRAPGPLGAALGRKDVYLELIVDGAHVDPTLIRWTRALHPPEKTCFVSDCVPCAGTGPGGPHSFGDLQIHLEMTPSGPSARLPNGALAGGGALLGESYAAWLKAEARATKTPLEKLFKQSVSAVTQAPLGALPISTALKKAVLSRKVAWSLPSVTPRPVR